MMDYDLPSESTLIGTPVHPLIHAIIRSASHVTAAQFEVMQMQVKRFR